MGKCCSRHGMQQFTYSYVCSTVTVAEFTNQYERCMANGSRVRMTFTLQAIKMSLSFAASLLQTLPLLRQPANAITADDDRAWPPPLQLALKSCLFCWNILHHHYHNSHHPQPPSPSSLTSSRAKRTGSGAEQ
jgi:hypothetical protein